MTANVADHPVPTRRPLWRFVALLLLAGAAGYLSRRYSYRLPLPIRKRTGDALWASSFFALFRLIWRDAPTTAVAVGTVLFSFGVEFSQLYHAPGIDHLRSYRLGSMLLGNTFFWLDDAAYIVGVAAIAPLDRVLMRRPRRTVK